MSKLKPPEVRHPANCVIERPNCVIEQLRWQRATMEALEESPLLNLSPMVI
jgi:hypothetical protein